MPKILIADDNSQIVSILSDYAKKDEYIPISAFDGLEAIQKFENENPDVILLDVMMPQKDGFEVCKNIRRKSNVPIIMITARSEDFEKIMGLDIGADDYITKPFSPGEVMARVRAIMRRINHEDEKTAQIFEFDNLKINLDDYVVSINENIISLTKKEIEILWTLVTNKNKVFSRASLLNRLWGYDYLGDNRTVDSHIKRLRAKLDEQEHETWEIKTIWGVGYKFEGCSDVQE
ncbi:response regulator transcription factor [Clostridium sp. UBA6640]|uniref:response regulator transcription factor n=1 Tax=Clostridium sp. UBA6640 TaxID=1946370 RepID=UPI0025B82908|nr:response regulator transcription factor [Clostridium sp. UBA6640]